MAITITRPTAGVSSTANATSYAGPVIAAPTANSLLIAFVAATGTNGAGTMTGGGLTWTRGDSMTFGSGFVDKMYVFWAKCGASPISTTATFACTDDAATGCEISVLMATGYDTVTPNPIKQFGQNTTGASTVNGPVVFNVAPITTNAVAASMAGQLAAASVTPPTSWTEADDTAHVTPAGNQATAYRTSGQTANTSFTHATTFWGTMSVEIYDAGAGPAANKHLGLLGVG